MTARVDLFLSIPSLLIAASLVVTGALAHGGEVHGDEGHAPLATLAVAPRAVAQSDQFELVAVLEANPRAGQRLRLTADRFVSNEPVTGAKIEIEANGENALAQEETPGVYVLALAALADAAPGAKLPLTISIEAGDTADLLTTTLEIPATTDPLPSALHERSPWVRWLAGVALALTAALLLIRARKPGKTRE